jgi:hypothetical protein
MPACVRAGIPGPPRIHHHLRRQPGQHQCCPVCPPISGTCPELRDRPQVQTIAYHICSRSHIWLACVSCSLLGIICTLGSAHIVAPALCIACARRSTLAALQSPLSKTSSALTAYQGSPSSGSYTTLYATISGSSGSLQAATVAQGVASAGTSAAAAFSSLQSTVTRVNASVSAASGALSGQQSAVGSLTSLLGSAAAASQVSSYLDILSGIADTYNNLPTPKSNVSAVEQCGCIATPV